VREDGTICAVYHHWDGYPEQLLVNLITYIHNRGVTSFIAKVREGRAGGGFSVFPDQPYKDKETQSWQRPDIRGQLNQDYAYLFSERTGEFVEFYKSGGEHPTSLGEQMAGLIKGSLKPKTTVVTATEEVLKIIHDM